MAGRPGPKGSLAEKITSFFSKSSEKRRRSEISSCSENASLASLSDSLSSSSSDSDLVQCSAMSELEACDIADFVNRQCSENPPSHHMLMALIKSRAPPPSLPLPSRQYKDAKRKSGVYTRTCNRAWFDAFDFISFSKRRQGLFCLPCVLFPASAAHTGAKRAKILLEEPMTNWKDALSDLRSHGSLSYHLDAAAKMKAFLSTSEHPDKRIDMTMTAAARARVEKNRRVLISIVKCLELCGRQGIALRGHRDDSTSDEVNQGKFKAIVDFRIEAGDEVLKEHLQVCVNFVDELFFFFFFFAMNKERISNFDLNCVSATKMFSSIFWTLCMRALLSSIVHRLIFFLLSYICRHAAKGPRICRRRRKINSWSAWDPSSWRALRAMSRPASTSPSLLTKSPMSQGGSSWELPFDLSRMEKPRKNW